MAHRMPPGLFWRKSLCILAGLLIPILVFHNLAGQLFPSRQTFLIDNDCRLLDLKLVSHSVRSSPGDLKWYYFNQQYTPPDREAGDLFSTPQFILQEISPLAANSTNGVVILLWLGSILLLWRRFDQVPVRRLFLLAQVIGINMIYPLAHNPPWLPPWSLISIKFLAYFMIAPVFLHYVLTFPVNWGSNRKGYPAVLIGYAAGLSAFGGWLFGGNVGWRLGTLISLGMIILAFGLMISTYQNRATQEERRRLRLIFLGTLYWGIPPVVLYMLPVSLGLSWSLPEWAAALFMVGAPISYLYATSRNQLFGIDRLLNRSLVYVILTLVTFTLVAGPVVIIYRRLPESRFLQAVLITAMTLLVGWGFDRARCYIQVMVDRIFYGGSYDYPGVVETISEELAASQDQANIRAVLTHRVPELMRLKGANLWVGESNETYPHMPGMSERFRFRFQSDVPAQWTVGEHKDGSDLNAGDLRILNTLARQAEIALNNVLLLEMLREQLLEIQLSQKALSQAQHQLLRSREEERSRLARELHDGPIQALVALNIQIGLMVSSDQLDHSYDNQLSEMRAEVRVLLGELRQVCAELRPPMLDALGLGAALNAYVEDWQEGCGIRADLEIPANDSFQDLPGEVAVNLYRVAQEALVNAARHSQASTVCVLLQRDEDGMVMSIQDDGIGFTQPDTLHDLTSLEHYGMVGMRERIELIGGKWSVDSSPGKGTTIRVLWTPT